MHEVHVLVGDENWWIKQMWSNKFAGDVIRGLSNDDVSDQILSRIRDHNRRVRFKIKGGLLGDCLRAVAEEVLNNGSWAELNLLYCAMNAGDSVPNAGPELIDKRRAEFSFKTDPVYLNNPRLSVVSYVEIGW